MCCSGRSESSPPEAEAALRRSSDAGIEFKEGSPECAKFAALLKDNFPDRFKKVRFPASAGYGIKAVSREGTERLVAAAIDYALQNGKPSVTLVHKGNIMKFTEGAFKDWGYAVAKAGHRGKARELQTPVQRFPSRRSG